MKLAVAGFLALMFVLTALGKMRRRKEFVRYLGPAFGRRAPSAAVAAITLEWVLAGLLCLAGLELASFAVAGVASAAFIALVTVIYAWIVAWGGSGQCACTGDWHLLSGKGEDVWRYGLVGVRNGFLAALALFLGGEGRLGIVAGFVAMLAVIAIGLIVGIVRLRRTLRRRPTTESLAARAREMKMLQAQTWWIEGEPRPM